MNQLAHHERLMQILVKPRISEKSAFVEQYGQYIFSVVADANKKDIKHAVELLFKVKVDSVNIVNPHGKTKRTTYGQGHRKVYKKAYVTLVSGDRINLNNA